MKIALFYHWGLSSPVSILKSQSPCHKMSLTHSRRALFRVFDSVFGQIEDILGIILVKEFFKKSN